jgi:hypothetical protein
MKPLKRAIAVAATLLAMSAFVAPWTSASAAAAFVGGGHVDSLTVTGLRQVQAKGWVADGGAWGTSINVAVYVDSTGHAAPANLPRPDVQAAYHTTQDRYGFSLAVPVPGGVHRVCVYALSVDGKANQQLTCKTISMPVNPGGHVDSVRPLCSWPTGFPPYVVRGWAFDPDTNGGPTTVDYYIDYQSGPPQGARTQAALARPDVQRAYGLANDKVGFSFQVGTENDAKDVRVYAINAAGTPGRNVFLGKFPFYVPGEQCVPN